MELCRCIGLAYLALLFALLWHVLWFVVFLFGFVFVQQVQADYAYDL